MSKPRKPYPTYPLTPHARGGWAKKYKGVYLYIALVDPEQALAEFHRRAADIDAGHAPRRTIPRSQVCVEDVIQRYLAERRKDQEAGTLSLGALEDYRAAAADMAEAFGSARLVDELGPDDFTALYRTWEKRLGAHALGRRVQNCRTLWKHAEENDWIAHRPRFGTVFRKPVTSHKAGTPFSAWELASVYQAAHGQLRAMILLMATCGYTAKDCSALPRSAVDLSRRLIRFPRPKMARRRPIQRVGYLCEELAEDLAPVLAQRPADALVFCTCRGKPWVRDVVSKKGKAHTIDSISLLFRRLCQSAGIPVRGPSWLRHWCYTSADNDPGRDPHAIARIMGHRLAGMAEVYNDGIERDRIRHVAGFLRDRLLIHPQPQR